MASNIKRKPDYVRLGLAITAVLAVLTLVFCAFQGFGLKIGDIMDLSEQGNVSELKVISLSLLDLMLGIKVGAGGGSIETISGETEGQGYAFSFGPITVNGLRAAFILIIIAIVIAAVIIYGILSKKFSYKTLKILTIANIVIMIVVAALILCTKLLIAKEVTDVWNKDLEEEIVTKTGCKTLTQLILKFSALGWGAIAAAATALVSAVGNIGILIYAKVNKIEL